MTEGKISPWVPEQDPFRLAMLSKLIEECNELAGRAARCISHGLEQVDPDKNRPNADLMADEMADVIACMTMIEVRLGITPDDDRIEKKFEGYKRWHALIPDALVISEETAEAAAREHDREEAAQMGETSPWSDFGPQDTDAAEWRGGRIIVMQVALRAAALRGFR
ncbi:hypothetical protein GCM10011321_31880 [Youhaiella tibetensis]|uniref:Uncharacterized protein n=1 Tax=Paradevosia tibetensis TaxID=1447062 RepID=A0A5B9DIF5_9HYPH|nr:hypothetical protein [Youhaiella tibetensis]QEE18853.1 hypothetical protein FNA67_01070 [Youhaiella tibetensis]GGF38551.1 hypothetical protein GCM10011321_31880 [Youhaiella tibetensis]